MTKPLQSLFNEIATTYDEHSILERETTDRLLDDLQYINIHPKVILDLGTGTGYATPSLQKKFPEAIIINFDFSINMLKRNPYKNRVCGDIFQAPFKGHSFDMIFSNHMIHLSENPDKLLRYIRMLLKPQGLFLFSALGPHTLLELHQTWASISNQTFNPPFLEMHDWVNLLGKNGFANPLLHQDTITLEYQEFQTLLNELKASGKTTPEATGKEWEELQRGYEQYRQSNATLPAHFEIISGHAWGFSL